MKKQVLSFTLQAPKHRAHRVLFDRELPFQPKVVRSKVEYKRRPKHRHSDAE
jgi:hypothetical protein